MATIPFLPDLFDTQGIHIVWDDQLRTPVQDPALGGTNIYGSTDIFYDSSGNAYQVGVPEGTVHAVGSPSAAPTPSSNPPDPIVQNSADIAAGTPTPSHDESGVVVNASDPSSPAAAVWRYTIFYVDSGRIIQKDVYSPDSASRYTDINLAAAPNLPNGTASGLSWDLAAANPKNQPGSTASTPASTAQNPASVQQQPTEPTAADGQTFSQQSAWTRATFTGLYGQGAAAVWVQQHNAALGQGSQQTTPAQQPPTIVDGRVTAGTRLPAGARTGAAVAGGMGSVGAMLGQPVRVGGMIVPTWAILGSLGAAYYLATSGGRHRR
jgi:hypothetical protein